MAETSRSRFDKNFTGSGQVVKRKALAPQHCVATKRSVRDRLGTHNSQPVDKRHRGDGTLTAFGADGFRDEFLDKDDLRFKLLCKNATRRVHSDDDRETVDLRDILSRKLPPPSPPCRSLDMRPRVPEINDTSMFGRVSSTTTADDFPRTDSSRSSYYSVNHDVRQRSPDRDIGTYRGLSPLRSMQVLREMPLCRTYEDVRAASYMSSGGFDTPRSMSASVPFMSKPALPTLPTKPVAQSPLSHLPLPGSSLQSSSLVLEERQTVESLLHSLGLGKFAIMFKAEEVDMHALKQMGDRDLKEMGIPMGPRKKILHALQPHSKRHP